MECIRGKTSAGIDAAGLAAGNDDVLIDVGTGDGREGSSSGEDFPSRRLSR